MKRLLFYVNSWFIPTARSGFCFDYAGGVPIVAEVPSMHPSQRQLLHWDPERCATKAACRRDRLHGVVLYGLRACSSFSSSLRQLFIKLLTFIIHNVYRFPTTRLHRVLEEFLQYYLTCLRNVLGTLLVILLQVYLFAPLLNFVLRINTRAVSYCLHENKCLILILLEFRENVKCS